MLGRRRELFLVRTKGRTGDGVEGCWGEGKRGGSNTSCPSTVTLPSSLLKLARQSCLKPLDAQRRYRTLRSAWVSTSRPGAPTPLRQSPWIP